MTALSLFPPFLAILVLGAHFFRAGEYAVVVLCAGLLALLFVRKAWAARALQAALFLGTAEWLRTTARFVQFRRAVGQPWTRLAVILGAVALLTAVSAFVFESARLRERYGLSGLSGLSGSSGPSRLKRDS